MKMIRICVTGDLGSGKSAVCEIMKNKYGFEVYHTGRIQREIASRHGMSTLELNKYAETHPEIDKEIDGALIKLAETNPEHNIVLDSRMAWHFVPNSFKVFLKVSIDTAVKRIMSDSKRGPVELYKSYEDAKKQLLLRKSYENHRYLAKYGVECSDYKNFDLVVDTSTLSPEEVAKIIVDAANAWSISE